MWTSPIDQTAHRPWPLPARRAAMTMTWRDLLFAHWPLPPDALRPLIPPALHLDTFDGDAWIGVVPFAMTNVGLLGIPRPPRLSAFLELNVRTYVQAGDRPGVFFFSLDAASPTAVRIARRWYHLPYFHARMRLRRVDGWVGYESERRHRGHPPGIFRGRYRPTNPVFQSRTGSLEGWLTERYCLYAVDRRGRAHRGEIHHHPWPLQPAEAEIETNTVAHAHGIHLPATPPLLHYAAALDVLAWTPTLVHDEERSASMARKR